MLDHLLRRVRGSGAALSPTLLRGATPESGGRLRVTGGAAVFDVALDAQPGWVQFHVRIGATAGSARARILADGADGSVTAGVNLGGDGEGYVLMRLPPRLSGIQLEIDQVAACEMPQVHARSLSALEAAAYLTVPLIRRRMREPLDLPKSGLKLLSALRRGGPAAIVDHLLRKQAARTGSVGYPGWRERFAALSPEDRASMLMAATGLQTRFSVILPTYETPAAWLERAIASVRAQLYPHWELCIADDASHAPHVRGILEQAAHADPRIKIAFRERRGHISATSNTALDLATGDFVALLDHDDELAEEALFVLASAADDADLIYSDEDKIDERGRLYDPFFKPDWNPDLLLAQNYVGHLCAFRRSLLTQIGGFREGFDGSQDYDLILRAAAVTSRIRHVPFVLYHWRSIPGSTARKTSAKSYAEDAALRTLREQVGTRGEVENGPLVTTYRVRWNAPSPPPLVSLIIPTRDAADLLKVCVESIIHATAYRTFELLIVDNQSRAPDALAYLRELEERQVARVLRFDAPFNFAAINNFAARHAKGTLLGLLNNDLEVIEGGWLDEMVSQASRPEIGAVGARLLYPDRTIQHGGIILGIGGIAGHEHKYAPADTPGYFSRAQLVHDVSAVTAACLVVRKQTFDRLNGLDETLAVAFNDVDFCLRVRQLGLRNLWTPFATLLHHESKSRGRDDDTAAKRSRFRDESRRMIARWGDALRNDPAYNSNLTLESEDFGLAWPPRVRKPWDASS